MGAVQTVAMVYRFCFAKVQFYVFLNNGLDHFDGIQFRRSHGVSMFPSEGCEETMQNPPLWVPTACDSLLCGPILFGVPAACVRLLQDLIDDAQLLH